MQIQTTGKWFNYRNCNSKQHDSRNRAHFYSFFRILILVLAKTLANLWCYVLQRKKQETRNQETKKHTTIQTSLGWTTRLCKVKKEQMLNTSTASMLNVKTRESPNRIQNILHFLPSGPLVLPRIAPKISHPPHAL